MPLAEEDRRQDLGGELYALQRFDRLVNDGMMRALLNRRFLLVSLIVLVTIGALAGGVVYWSAHRAGEAGRLSSPQWSRLKTGLESLAARAHNLNRGESDQTSASETAKTQTPPSDPRASSEGGIAESEPTTAVPVRPQRLPRPEMDPALLQKQMAAYQDRRAKSVIELQPFRQSVRTAIDDGGQRLGQATLINLNPRINVWYVLVLDWADGTSVSYHLANLSPSERDLLLDPEVPGGIILADSLERRPCLLWSQKAELPLERAARADHPYALLCEDQVTLRVETSGHRTSLEWTTDFLRDHIWGGEKLTVLVRATFFQDSFLSTAELTSGADIERDRRGPPYPRPARVRDSAADALILPADLGLSLEDSELAGMVEVGQWYRLRGQLGIFSSTINPGLVAEEISASYPRLASPLDEVEREALVYLLAFDLDLLELGFSIGTDHPRVGWSERVPDAIRDLALPGPDGIGDISPLVATGIIPAAAAVRTVATFAGGFKRSHGAFRLGELAAANGGSHYGFLESGVILSKLQPGLSTVFGLDDGQVRMKTWSREDDAWLERIVFARQNGVPLVEPDPETGEPRPGALISRWGFGNWSGSQDKKFRTVRAGLGLLETDGGKPFLLYAYFSSATPSAMARVFQAYGCSYAMLLDMNALEHTYSAVYRVENDTLLTEHLVRGMEVLDLEVEERVLPRFLGFADNRDYFYVLRREQRAGEQELAASVAMADSMLPALYEGEPRKARIP